MSDHPVIDKDYIRSILNLSGNQNICLIEITEVIESNTALVIKAFVQIQDADDKCTRKLFIKTIKHNESENAYHNKSMQEGKFYKLVNECEIDNLFVPVCYDAFVSEETGEFLIVMEDVSNNYTCPNDKILLDKNKWFSCADSLARLHSAFWNHRVIDLLQESSQTEKEIDSNASNDKERLQEFLVHFKDKFDDKTKRILRSAMEINKTLIREEQQRIIDKNNVTIRNGDSHIYNFMLPVVGGNNPLMIDFQFWGVGIAVGDLAHLTRVNFSDDFKKDIQIPLVEHYYKSLLAYGVTNYSWKNCLRDYRMCVATMVLIPFWQYSYYNAKYDEWISHLQGLINNYEYLKCDELYYVGN